MGVRHNCYIVHLLTKYATTLTVYQVFNIWVVVLDSVSVKRKNLLSLEIWATEYKRFQNMWSVKDS